MKNKANKIVSYITVDRPGTPFDPKVKKQLKILKNELGKGLSLEEEMELIWEITRPILPHDRIGLSFIDNHGQRVTSYYFKTDASDDNVFLGKNYSAGLAHSTLKGIMEKNAARIISDLRAYLKANPHSQSTRLLLKEGVSSNLTLPLMVKSRMVGFLFFSSRKSGVFKSLHARILLAVLDLISQNIEKVWLIRKLEESRQDYLNMLGFVSHEMKSPLAAMMTVGSTYLKGYTGKVDPGAETIIRKMMKISGYLINMVKNYLDMSRLENGEMTYNPQKGVKFIDEVLDFALDTVSPRAEERGNRMVQSLPESNITLEADTDLLRIVAVNLLDNAIKYGEEKTDVQVTVRTEKKWLVFSVQNRGVGFTREQSKKLFQRFSRLKQKGLEDRRGSGLGLYLTWWIVQKHGGHIKAESEPGQWARFTVKIKTVSKP
jgi:K+-sensing histidine kinase KdpD